MLKTAQNRGYSTMLPSLPPGNEAAESYGLIL